MDCATKGIITDDIYEDAQVKRLLTLAKENMVQDFERRYEERFNKRNEELKREYEEQYRTQIDECKNKIEQQDTIIENHKREINVLKEETKSKDTKIDKLEEEFKKKRVVFKLPPVRQFRFDFCEKPNSDLLEFLKSGSPDSVKHFAFGYYSCTTGFKPIDYYLDGLEVAIRGATEEVFTAYWTHSKESLQRLVKAGAGATTFIIWYCKMDLDSDLDFSGTDYKIQYFGLPYCGNRVSEDWSGHPERIERIIKAFSKCGIKDSLQTFGVYECGVSADKIKQMFNDHGMNAVSVIEEAKSYSK